MISRVIKFRGWSLKNNKWLYGDLVRNRGKVYIAPTEGFYFNETAENFEVDSDSVGQFTGFLDNAGHEVYEWGYMENEWQEKSCGSVRMLPGSWCLIHDGKAINLRNAIRDGWIMRDYDCRILWKIS